MYEPYNAVTGKPYQGENILTLTIAAQKLNGLNDSRWFTFLQAKELGYKVKKGSHGTTIAFWKFDTDDTEKPTSELPTSRPRPLVRHYTVFHASQIEGVPELC